MTEEEKRKSVLKFLKAKGYMNQAQQEYMFNVVDLILEYTEQSRQTDVSGSLPLAESLLSSIETANPNEDVIIKDLHKQCKKLVKELRRQ